MLGRNISVSPVIIRECKSTGLQSPGGVKREKKAPVRLARLGWVSNCPSNLQSSHQSWSRTGSHVSNTFTSLSLSPATALDYNCQLTLSENISQKRKAKKYFVYKHRGKNIFGNLKLVAVEMFRYPPLVRLILCCCCWSVECQSDQFLFKPSNCFPPEFFYFPIKIRCQC